MADHVQRREWRRSTGGEDDPRSDYGSLTVSTSNIGGNIMFNILMLFYETWCDIISKISSSLVKAPRINDAFILLLLKQINAATYWVLSQQYCRHPNQPSKSTQEIKLWYFNVQCGGVSGLFLQIKIWKCSSLHTNEMHISWGKIPCFLKNFKVTFD